MNKIDLIIDALSHCAGWGYTDHKKVDAALAAARELKALKPVAEREWVGLTDDERSRYKGYTAETFVDGVIWAEAKLRERNT